MKNAPSKAVILAAGWGSRLLPATKAIAKPMLPVVDKPAIEYIVTDLVAAGIKDIIIIGKQHFEQIEEHFDRHLELERMLKEEAKLTYLDAITRFNDVNFTFIRQNILGGTGDAVRSAFHLLDHEEPIIVCYSDDLLYPHSCIKEMIALYSKYPGTIMTVKKVPKEQLHLYGVVNISKPITDRFYQIKGIVEKPQEGQAPSEFAFLTPVILSPETLKLLGHKPKTESKDNLGLTQTVSEAAEQGLPVYVYETDMEWRDVGNKLEYMKTQVRFALDDPAIKSELKKYIKEIL